MATDKIKVKMLANMFLGGSKNLDGHKEFINELNVFPVPDGDTGTNMTMTIMSAAKEVSALENPSMESISKAIASGSLRGARGNSGVILSQLLRGFTKVISSEKELTTDIVAKACVRAKETAYKAVMKPKEGTILTVASGIADKATELAATVTDFDEFIPGVIEYAEEVLDSTPELLPVLKEAGVVDSGGQGLLEILKGAYAVYRGEDIDLSSISGSTESAPRNTSYSAHKTDEDIKFGYCTEFIIETSKEFTHEDEKDFKGFLNDLGDSIVMVADDDLVKIHVHTNHPGKAIEKALTYGELSRMKIDNMREEHRENLRKEIEAEEAKKVKDMPHKEVGFLSISIGEGLSDVFRELGVDGLIEGGQTMNPSTEDILSKIDEVNADTIFLLPNNKNIILAANQAKALSQDKRIVVIPTKTIPQGITAMISYNESASIEENESMMNEVISTVKTGQVTYAVRDTRIDDKDIKTGDIMGIGDKNVLSVAKTPVDAVMEMLDELVDEDSELISIYFGSDIKKEEAESLLAQVEEKYPDLDVDLQDGGQPIYYYIIAVE